MKTLSQTLHAGIDAVLAKSNHFGAPNDPDLARRCLQAERVTLVVLALAIAVLFALSGGGQAVPYPSTFPADVTPASAQFGWPI
jgi:hypothetical protein